MGIVIFILVLLVLVLVHEFGHFIFAKKSGIRVDEFGFGFPPKLFGKKVGETEYTFNALPIGGFVRIFGETPDEDSLAGPDAERSFVNKPAYIQAAVLLAGVVFNWLLAWILLSAIFMMGTPYFANDPLPRGGSIEDTALTIFAVSPESPAYDAGLRGGERLISISAGEQILLDEGYASSQEYIEDFRLFLDTYKETGVDLTYTRPNSDVTEVATVLPTTGIADDRVAIGVGIDYVGTLRVNPLVALWEGGLRTIDLTVLMTVGFFDFFGDIAKGDADFSEVSGPVGIAGMVSDASETGLVSLLFLTAIISINLAILNLLPFPALDGGRLLFLLIEVVKGSPIKPQVANVLNAAGFLLLIGLMILVTYSDILKVW
jgi:regulator of sigma E protease